MIITIKAANDITLFGGNINAHKNADIVAIGNVSLLNEYDQKEYRNNYDGNSIYTFNKDVVASSINSGSNLYLSGNNVNLVGSSINTNENSSIVANNIDMIGVYNTSIVDTVFVTKKRNLVSSKTTKEHTHQEDYIVVSSSINSQGKTNLISNTHINVIASNIEGSETGLYAGSKLDSKGNIIASGNIGNINLINMDNKHIYQYTKEVKKRGLNKNMFNDYISFDGGFKEQITLGYNDYTKETSNSTEVVGSIIKANDTDLNIKASGNITSISSNIAAAKDNNIEANNIYLLVAQNTYNSTKYHKHEDIKLTIGIGNTYLDAANAVYNLAKDVNKAANADADLLATITIDNRLLTQKGREEVIGEIQQSAKNLNQNIKDIKELSTKLAKYLTPANNKKLQEVVISLEELKQQYNNLEGLTKSLKVELTEKDKETIRTLTALQNKIDTAQQNVINYFISVEQSLQNRLKEAKTLQEQAEILGILTDLQSFLETKVANNTYLKNAYDDIKQEDDVQQLINTGAVLTGKAGISKYVTVDKNTEYITSVNQSGLNRLKVLEGKTNYIKIKQQDGTEQIFYFIYKDTAKIPKDTVDPGILASHLPKDSALSFNDLKIKLDGTAEVYKPKGNKFILIPKEDLLNNYKDKIYYSEEVVQSTFDNKLRPYFEQGVNNFNIRLILNSRGQTVLDQNSYNVIFADTYNKGSVFKDKAKLLENYLRDSSTENLYQLKKYVYSHATTGGEPHYGLTIRDARSVEDLVNKTDCSINGMCYNPSILQEVENVMGKEHVDKLKEQRRKALETARKRREQSKNNVQ